MEQQIEKRDKPDYQFRTVLIGNPNVGKSSIIHRLVHPLNSAGCASLSLRIYIKYINACANLDNHAFNDYPAVTIGVDFQLNIYTIDCKKVKLQVWDLPGPERPKTVTSSYSAAALNLNWCSSLYYKNTSCLMVVFDVTDKESFERVDEWIKSSLLYIPEGCLKILCANKIDLAEHRCISSEEAIQKASEHEMVYYETSAKYGTNISEVFEMAAKVMKDRKDKDILKAGFVRHSFYLEESETYQVKKKCC